MVSTSVSSITLFRCVRPAFLSVRKFAPIKAQSPNESRYRSRLFYCVTTRVGRRDYSLFGLGVERMASSSSSHEFAPKQRSDGEWPCCWPGCSDVYPTKPELREHFDREHLFTSLGIHTAVTINDP